jgi:hypothetical protein
VLSPAGHFYSAEVIKVSLPANTYFKSKGGQALHVAECADPGGKVSNLPTLSLFCDGFTSTRVIARRWLPDELYDVQPP